MAARAGGKTSNVTDVVETSAHNFGANGAGFTAGITESTVNETIGRDYDVQNAFLGNDGQGFVPVPREV